MAKFSVEGMFSYFIISGSKWLMIACPHLYSNYLGKFPIFENFTLSFSIKPLGKMRTVSNVLHISTTGESTTRMPAVDILPDSTIPRFSFYAALAGLGSREKEREAGYVLKEETFGGPALALGKATNVKLIVSGSKVRLYYDGKLVKEKTYGGPLRVTGEAHVYASRYVSLFKKHLIAYQLN